MAENQLHDIKKENAVFDYLNKFCRNRSDFKALFLNIHQLDEKVRQKQDEKLLSDLFMPLEKGTPLKLFTLPNEDALIIFSKNSTDEIASVLVKLRFIWHEDAKVASAPTLEESGTAVFYDLGAEGADFSKKLILSCYVASEKNQPFQEEIRRPVSSEGVRRARHELTPEMLAKVQKIISVADFSSFIRRQAVCAIIGKSKPQRVFEEVFVSIPDMRDALLPDVDLTSNPWLFLALTETLDKRVLEIISHHDDGSLAGNFSININVSTILSDDFLRFDDSINGAMRQTIILELQLADIFSDIRSFIFAKTFAKARGYKICIDGITVDKLKYLNRKGLDCDLMKIIWNPAFVDIISEDAHFMDYMNKAERAKIILCRVDDTAAIEAGNSLGINLYQGRYVQRLLNSGVSKR